MYIDTTSKQMMEESIYQVLHITKQELQALFEECYNHLQNNKQVFILDDQYDFFTSFVVKHVIKSIDEILFIHLSRRLSKDASDNTYNFRDVLVKDTSLSSYLKQKGITFKYQQHLQMLINNKEVIFSNKDYIHTYLNDRFGSTHQDYSISGYVFADHIQQSEFYEIAKDGPEFLGYVCSLVDDDALIDDFLANSNLYQLQYVVPLKDICFDDYDELNDKEKQIHLIVKILQRLYFYEYDSVFNEDDNTSMKYLNDNMLSEIYLKKKILIDTEL